MNVDERIERIAEILDLETAPSEDQAARLADLLQEVYDEGSAVRGGVSVQQTIDTVAPGSTIVGYSA